MSFMGLGVYDSDPEKSREFLIKAKENRGNVVVYDEIRDRELTELEIKQLVQEVEANSGIPILIEGDNVVKINIHKQRNRKYKSRLPISPRLRKAVIELHNKECSECGKEDANQIHHEDENPSNNNIDNLCLLCYDCHLKKHKKKVIIENE